MTEHQDLNQSGVDASENIYEPFQIFRKLEEGVQVFLGLRSIMGRYKILSSHFIYGNDANSLEQTQKIILEHFNSAIFVLCQPFDDKGWHKDKISALRQHWPKDARPLKDIVTKTASAK